MKILITGATGFIGSKLTQQLISLNHSVNILTRNKLKAEEKFKSDKINFFEWKDVTTLPPKEAFENIDAVINLMGENIGAKPWSEKQKIKLRQSRVEATQNIVNQIHNLKLSSLKVFVSASAIGIYPVNLKSNIDENTPAGYGFLAKLCQEWEDASISLEQSTRRVIVRTGVVLEKNDGALKKMLPPFQLGLGGPIGDGNQFMSWIHLDDVVNVYLKILNDTQFKGTYNAVSPNPVSNFDFTKALGHALNRPTLIPVPGIALKLALGEMSSIILDSQRIVPTNLISSGFQFKYEQIDSALDAILQ